MVCLFVALSIQHAMRMRLIVICSLPRSTIIFHIFSQTTWFKKNVTEHKMCVLIFSTNLSKKFLILTRNERALIKYVYCSSCKVTFILVRFQWRLNFVNRFSKNPQITKFMKILLLGAELFRADGQTDRRKEANTHILQNEPTYGHKTNYFNNECKSTDPILVT
jgi:hypothetical protein